MTKVFEINLCESDEIRPFYGPYGHYNDNHTWTPIEQQGLVSLMGTGLAHNPIFKEVKGLELNFYGDDSHGKELWATKYRLKVLKNLTSPAFNWYLGFDFFMNDFLIENLITTHDLEYTVIRCPSYNDTFDRLIFSIPNHLIEQELETLWAKQSPGYTIEGYLLEPGKINQFDQWDKQPRDSNLFRQVLDEVQYVFYTNPAENRDFIFITNKYSFDDFKRAIDYETLWSEIDSLNT